MHRTARIDSVDILRGLVCVLMAIDHVRVYAGVPAGGPTYDVFLTRWVTHFVAPGFAFFAGTAAFFHGRKLADLGALSRYLASRGLLLVALELTLVRFTWTFNLQYGMLTLMGVIWMLGWCMVLLAAMVRLGPAVVGLAGVAIVLLQQLFLLPARLIPEDASLGWLYGFVYPAGIEPPGSISILYVLVPWIGVMAAGYGFGLILLREEAERRRACLRIGVGATLLFLVAGSVVTTVTPAGDDPSPWLIRLLNQNKYPASQLFLLMTLGPLIALVPFAERWRGWWVEALRTIGRVPLFYYLLHIPLIHLAGIAVMVLRGAFDPAWYDTAPYSQVPDEQRWPLPLLYAVWLGCLAILYPLCRWYAGVKARRPGNWLRYV